MKAATEKSPFAPERMAAELSALGITSSQHQREQLSAWLTLLAHWNKACGLTAMPPATWLKQLVAHSAMALPYLKLGSVLDVGSGGGAPGIVLAILAPNNEYTLVESTGKKASFLDHCCEALELSNTTVENCRAEALKARTYDNIIARAFGSLSKLLRLTWHLSGRQSRWLSFKGAHAARQEMQSLGKQNIQSRVLPLHALGSEQPSALVLIDRLDRNG